MIRTWSGVLFVEGRVSEDDWMIKPGAIIAEDPSLLTLTAGRLLSVFVNNDAAIWPECVITIGEEV